MKTMKIFFFLFVAGVMVGCSKNDGEDNGEPWNPGLLATDPVPSKAFDPLFYIWCTKTFDKNGDGILQYGEIMSEAEMVANYTGYDDYKEIARQITSLKGIEYFTGLKRLYWYGECNLSSVDLSKNILLEDIFLYGKLTILDVSKNTVLKRLWCQGGSSLDSKGILKTLILGKNQLVLEELDCSYNQISSLDVSGCLSLKKLNGSYNPLEKIYVWKGWTKPYRWYYSESVQIIEK